MANVVMGSSNSRSNLDGSVKTKVYDFFDKLRVDDTAPGLHIEPINGAIDRRVRTARVDRFWRAILFRVEDKSTGPTYFYMGTWPHDEANGLAERATLRVNPINGTLEALIGENAPDAAANSDASALAWKANNAQLSFLEAVGYSLSDLTERLGIGLGVAEHALAALDENGLLEVAADALAWEGSALLDLATGLAIETIRDKHGFSLAPVDASPDDDQQIIDALERPASKMQFVFVDDNEELRRVIEGGDFAAWRTFLHPEQRRYVESDFNGTFRLSGGAGTGKTVVAIHRARRIAKRNPDARIVLTTFNAALAQGLRADLLALDPDVRIADHPGDAGVYVGGVDALGKAVLDHSGGRANTACENVLGSAFDFGSRRTSSEALWREVLAANDPSPDARLATPAFLENEYVAVVLANRITMLEQYTRIPRPGRGVRLSRP